MKLPQTLAKILLISAFTAALPAAAQPLAQDPRAIVVEDVSHSGFANTLDALKQQLEADGWNIVAEINLGARLAKKNVAIPGGLVILELTSGKNAVPLLKSDDTRYVAALMPCSVAVYGMSDGRVMISRMNAGLMAGMMEPKVAEVMKSAAIKLDETIGRSLAKSGR
jgi:uncharacterized protein (DUF302 family)